MTMSFALVAFSSPPPPDAAAKILLEKANIRKLKRRIYECIFFLSIHSNTS